MKKRETSLPLSKRNFLHRLLYTNYKAPSTKTFGRSRSLPVSPSLGEIRRGASMCPLLLCKADQVYQRTLFRSPFSGGRTLGGNLPIRASALLLTSRIQVGRTTNGSADHLERLGSSADPCRSPCVTIQSHGPACRARRGLQQLCGKRGACVGAACRLAAPAGSIVLPFGT